MEAANQVAAYISKLDQQPIRWIFPFREILIYIRCKHKIYLDLKANETFFKTNCEKYKIHFYLDLVHLPTVFHQLSMISYRYNLTN